VGRPDPPAPAPLARLTRSAVCAAALALVLGLPAGALARSWPDTSRGVHVFNDQLASGLTPAQERFAARRYADEAIVNPALSSRTVRLRRAAWLAVPHGGGPVSAAGRPAGRLGYRRVRTLRLAPVSAAVLLSRRP
jgi:hypothetical protein